jgi:outer membrane protein assembly factor BamB
MTRSFARQAVLATALIFAVAARAADEWPRFRGPTGMGTSDATGVPVKWSADENVAWKVAVPGRGWSSPVVGGGRIYLTTAIDKPVVALRALCFDLASGKLLWNTELFTPDARAAKAFHSKNGLASPTPVVSGDRVYAHFGHMGTAALDLGGKVIWRQTEIRYSPVHGNAASPILVDGLLVFSCDGAADPFLAALHADTGKIAWRTPRQNTVKKRFSFATALEINVGGQTQIVSPASGLVGGYDPKSGKDIWRVTYDEGYSVVPCPVYAQGLLVLSKGFDQPMMIAIRPEGAAGDVTATNVAWRIGKNASHTPSAVVAGDEVYFVSDGGFATCADLKTGKVHWTERLGGNFSASPVVAEGRVYIPSEAGVVFVFKAGTAYELLAKNDLGERTLASPAPIEQGVILRSESHLWRIGKASR